MKHESGKSIDAEVEQNLAELIEKLNENNLISLINLSDFCGLNEKNKTYTRNFFNKLISQSNDKIENTTNETKGNQGKILAEITSASQSKLDNQLSQIYEKASNGNIEYLSKNLQVIVDNIESIKPKYRKSKLPSFLAKLILEKKVTIFS